MSDAVLITLLAAPWGGIGMMLTWQYIHQKNCGDRWQKFSELKGRVDQYHQDHNRPHG